MNNKKLVCYWSPFVDNVATVKAVINSALSINKYSNQKFVSICADIESQIIDLKPDERENYMKNIGLEKTGLDKLITSGYDLLNLNTFFTSGPKETRAWTIKKILQLKKQQE